MSASTVVSTTLTTPASTLPESTTTTRATTTTGPPPPSGPYFGQDPPGTDPIVFAPGFISTDEVEFAGSFSPDGTEYYFTRRPRGDASDHHQQLLFTRLEAGAWTAPEPVPFGFPAVEFEPFVTPDGDLLLYTSMRPLPDGSSPDPATIWKVQLSAPGWSDPELLAPSITTPMMYATTASDGSLYYTGGADLGAIWVAEPEATGYGEPTRLGSEVNVGRTAHPFVAADESFLLFDSQRAGGFGGSDLYVSFRGEDGSWTEGVNLGPTINTEHGELVASVSPDGRFLFFARFVAGVADIYWVDASILTGLQAG